MIAIATYEAYKVFHGSQGGTFGADLSQIWDGAHGDSGWVGLDCPLRNNHTSIKVQVV